MKPFRGKPEKPKRSNGEIQRQRSRLPCGSRCRVASAARHAVAAACPGSTACTSPLVGRRDPLGVGPRPVWSTVPRKRGRPSVARPTARRYRMLFTTVSSRIECVRLVGRLVSLGFTDLAPLPGAWRAVSRRCPRTGSEKLITGRRRFCFGYFQDPS